MQVLYLNKHCFTLPVTNHAGTKIQLRHAKKGNKVQGFSDWLDNGGRDDKENDKQVLSLIRGSSGRDSLWILRKIYNFAASQKMKKDEEGR